MDVIIVTDGETKHIVDCLHLLHMGLAAQFFNISSDALSPYPFIYSAMNLHP